MNMPGWNLPDAEIRPVRPGTKNERRWCMSGEPHFPVVVTMYSHVLNPNKQLQKLFSRKENPK
jgi:hypothetical protein